MKKLLQFFRYKFSDFKALRAVLKSGKKPFNEYGLRLYSGCQGAGKTMSMVEQLVGYREQYPGLLIATNFGFCLQDLEITSLEEIPLLSRIARENGYTGVCIGWDEIQNDFDNQVRSFPISILRTITQQRKQGIKILSTSQVFTRVAKPIREQTFEVVECKTFAGRWTFQQWRDPIEYEYFIQNPDKDKKISCKKRYNFIQTDKLRDMFDSYAVIDALDNRVASEKELLNSKIHLLKHA